ncbi:MAG: pantoate--beta-alanine ligase [Flexistipes sinusarabici]|uniref:Pantothenate synthetase n=1 Tax=Flexistipes sinusarabici TaxID=2352 RepID=A0A5D0MWA2_FLESI|nr:pantoate--beta-alanine ligase [Flexistipes sinusarabici]TYB36460.1 MAG: pantoate--beta-alanine ligase [Flexistipes sinusarabici]
MKILHKIEDVRNFVKEEKGINKSIGLVPTMGFLHQGHLELVSKSLADNDITVVSIFVNPAQFGPNEDFESYPRDFDQDVSLLKEKKVDYVFAPSLDEMYPENFATKVVVSGITETLCGAKRPGHFEGVATVVTKLLNIADPDRAYFGMKDYQQLKVIERFVRDLNINTEIKGVSIVREKDGLAISSRNIYLSDEERESALSLVKSFNVVQNLLDEGERDADVIRERVIDFISGFKYTNIDYVSTVDPETLEYIGFIEDKFLLALAVYVGKARLIDNKIFEV